MDYNKIYIASDHAGFATKQKIISYLKSEIAKFSVIDLGCDNEDVCSYADFACKLAIAMKKDQKSLGVVICGSGIGISITANRYSHIRTALCYNENAALLAREHNDANVLALGGRTNNIENNIKILDIFLNTKFSNEPRHIKRIEQLTQIGEKI